MDSDEEEQVIVEVSDAILRDRKDDEISDEEEDHTSTPASRPATRMSTSEVEVRKGKECKIGAWICNCEDLIGNVDRVSYWKSLSFVNPVNASQHVRLFVGQVFFTWMYGQVPFVCTLITVKSKYIEYSDTSNSKKRQPRFIGARDLAEGAFIRQTKTTNPAPRLPLFAPYSPNARSFFAVITRSRT